MRHPHSVAYSKEDLPLTPLGEYALGAMDIEKAAPAGSVRPSVRKASYTPPKTHDDIDKQVHAVCQLYADTLDHWPVPSST